MRANGVRADTATTRPHSGGSFRILRVRGDPDGFATHPDPSIIRHDRPPGTRRKPSVGRRLARPGGTRGKKPGAHRPALR
ncbi:protein of unknown function (plasmid) [Cupriavidus taiwanensis]|uniref:Uncharacterized protein n=1 Tax=Cupriavidus taiwanensis TaxID=164546 RepID=A0A375ITP5_9BURK|nr:hypothetical protein CBM2608_B140218 [Cupriavidus taiwanensis]SPK76792.1 protein of unknown function [Cupriavidus taiwanensis]